MPSRSAWASAHARCTPIVSAPRASRPGLAPVRQCMRPPAPMHVSGPETASPVGVPCCVLRAKCQVRRRSIQPPHSGLQARCGPWCGQRTADAPFARRASGGLIHGVRVPLQLPLGPSPCAPRALCRHAAHAPGRCRSRHRPARLNLGVHSALDADTTINIGAGRGAGGRSSRGAVTVAY